MDIATRYKKRKYLISQGFLLFGSLAPIRAENCSLCEDATPPKDPTAIFNYVKGDIDQTVNCSFAHTHLAPAGEFANCTELHAATSDICGCGDIPTCSLCEDGKLPQPSRVVAGKTCAEWENLITYPFDCPAWQRSLGTYCGCDISTEGYFDGFCRICDTEILPDWNTQVTYTNGDKQYCAEIEQYSNSQYNLNCSQLQEEYRTPCGCREVIVFPTPAPQASDTRYINKNILSIVAGSISSIILATMVIFQ